MAIDCCVTGSLFFHLISLFLSNVHQIETDKQPREKEKVCACVFFRAKQTKKVVPCVDNWKQNVCVCVSRTFEKNSKEENNNNTKVVLLFIIFQNE